MVLQPHKMTKFEKSHKFEKVDYELRKAKLD